jgi:hypothetical protein
MSEATTLWIDDASGLVIKQTSEPSPDVVGLLERTVWGSRGLLYRIRDVGSKLRRLSDPYVFSVEKNRTLAGVCILNRKSTLLLGARYDAFHFVMIATDDALKGQGLANLLSEHIRRFCEKELRAPGVAYAYIESTTDYSIRISERVGHAFESHVPLTIFSRFFPKDDRRVRRMQESEAQGISDSLFRLYENHGFLDFENSLVPDEYYVLSHNGRVMAGAQAEVLHWSIVRMPGWIGSFIVNGLPRIPVLRRLLCAEDFYFLRFGNVLVRPGHEAELIALLEALLARNKVRVSLILMDRRSPVYQRIKAFRKLGLMNSAFTGATKVVADFKGVAEEDIVLICDQPVVVSPLDVI